MTPAEYDGVGRVFYKFDPGTIHWARGKFRSLPICFKCNGYIIVNLVERSPTNTNEGGTLGIRAFPPARISDIEPVKYAFFDVFHDVRRAKKLVTEIAKDKAGTKFHFYKTPDQKTYELAAHFARDLEKKVHFFKTFKDALDEEILDLHFKNNMAYTYLRDFEKMNAREWLAHLDSIAKENPRLYDDFMRRTMTPLQKEFIEELNKSPLTLQQFFEGTPKNESQVREIFDTFHYLFEFKILRSQEPFPDYLLFRNDKEIRTEAELYSKNFIQHKHNPKKCDMILCWENNINQKKIGLDVFELGTGRIHKKDGSVEEIIIRP